jgi:hypothetical protein
MAREGSRRRWVIALAVALGVLSAVAATTAARGTAAARVTAAAASVDVWALAPINAPNEDESQIPAGVKVAFRYVNAHGGLGKLHQKVVVKVCDTLGTPTGEVQCGQQAAADSKAIAVISPLIVRAGADFTAQLEQGSLPAINSLILTPPGDFSSPVNFPIWTSQFEPAGCAVMAGAATKAKSIGFTTVSLPPAIDQENAGIAAGEKAGFTTAAHIEFPITTTDVSPFVSQLASKNPDLTVFSGPPQLGGAWLAASARLGDLGPMCVPDGLVSYQVLAGLGSAVNNFYMAGILPEASWTGYPLLTQFRAQAAAEVKSGDKSASQAPANDPELVLYGWTASQAAIQAGANVKGTITRASFFKALNHTTVHFGSGKGALLPSINFAVPNPNPKYARLFNTRMFLKKWDPTKKAFVLVTNVPAVIGTKIVP